MTYAGNVWKIYASRFFHSLIPAYVIERLFWEQRGMTVQMVVYCEIVYATTIILLEVPTGVIADRWGRKRMLVISALLGCCEFLFLLQATKFWHFALVVFLAGVAQAVKSGSENALLYDSLAASARQSEFEMCLGRAHALGFGAAVIAAATGSLVASTYGYRTNYIVSVVSMLACLLATALLKEPDIGCTANRSARAIDYVAQSLRFLRGNPAVGPILLTGMILGASITYIDEFWQVYLDRLGIPVLYFGAFSIMLMLARLPGSILAHRLLRRFGYRYSLLAATATCVAGFLCIWAFPSRAGAAAMIVVCASSGCVDPLVSGYLHHRVDSTIRATVDSFQSLGLRIVAVAIGLGFGSLVASGTIFSGFGFVAAICGLFLCCVLVSVKTTNG